jgi:nucleoside-diphosphate-sugar epimerase
MVAPVGHEHQQERPLDGRTVLVTGAGGFIGRWVTQALVDAGAEVRAMVGPPGEAYSSPAPGVEVHQAWIDDAAALADMTEGADVIVHLAGPPSVSASFASPADFARSHVVGTVQLLEACRDRTATRAVWMSSAEVYGRGHANPVGERHPLDPTSPYAAAKIGAEAMISVLGPHFGMASVILRPFLVYGPGMASTSLVATVIRQVLESDEVVLADLQPVRDLCFVEDVARAVVAACHAKLSGNVVVCNVGSGRGHSVQEIAARVVALAGKSLTVRAASGLDRPASASVNRLVADVATAARELGWAPSTDLDTGLSRTLRWYQEGQATRPWQGEDGR